MKKSLFRRYRRPVYTPAREQARISKFYAEQNLMRASIPLAAMTGYTQPKSIEAVTIAANPKDKKAEDLAAARKKQNWTGDESNTYFQQGKTFKGRFTDADLQRILQGSGPKDEEELRLANHLVDPNMKLLYPSQEDNPFMWSTSGTPGSWADALKRGIPN